MVIGLMVVVILVALALFSRDGPGRASGGGHRGHTAASDLRTVSRATRRLARAAARAWCSQERAWGECWRVHQPWRGDDLPAHRGELRWRQVDGNWRLDGRTVPGRPPSDKPNATA